MFKIDFLQNFFRKYGREGITLVAATKMQPAETVNALPLHGVTIAGENKVQELLQKYPSVRGVEWHFIGRLQTNKVKYLIDKVSCIQSVDRISLAKEIQKQAEKHDVCLNVFVEVNIAEDPAKGGVFAAELPALLAEISKMDRLRLSGLMTVLPVGAEDALYEKAHDVFLQTQQKYPSVRTLSMGMSGDYEKAIAHGATMVRLGSALFGAREYAKENATHAKE